MTLPHVMLDGTAVIGEAHTIPSTGPYTIQLGPTAPTGWQLVIPDGAYPLGKPTAPTATPQAGGSLTVSSAYIYGICFVTQNGSTKLGTEVTATLTSGQTAVLLSNIPVGINTVNPVIERRIFRTVANGASGTEHLCATLYDNVTTDYVDITPDTDLRPDTPPGSDGSGLQLVTISGYTEVANTPASNQFSVDYSSSPSGGTITFNSANAGANITINYTGGTLVNDALFNSIIDLVNIPSAIQQRASTVLTASGAVPTSLAIIPGASISITKLSNSSKIRFSLIGNAFSYTSSTGYIVLQGYNLTTATNYSASNSNFYFNSNNNQEAPLNFIYDLAGLAAGTYTLQIWGQIYGTGSPAALLLSNCLFTIEEYN